MFLTTAQASAIPNRRHNPSALFNRRYGVILYSRFNEMDAHVLLIRLILFGFRARVVIVHDNILFFAAKFLSFGKPASSVYSQNIAMKPIDMKHLRKSAALVPLVALPVVALPASAQGTDEYRVVVNHEEQYSIWFADRELPAGWKDTGEAGTREECLAYIEEVWTDMRPLSLRKRIEANKDLARGNKPYKVVINHEEQYSIWLRDQKMTDEWRETGETCSLKECMAYIEEVWTDMRPLSLRKTTEERKGQ